MIYSMYVVSLNTSVCLLKAEYLLSCITARRIMAKHIAVVRLPSILPNMSIIASRCTVLLGQTLI